MTDDKELEEIEAFFLAMQTPTPKRTLTIRSESGEFIGYCEAPEIEDVYAAQRQKAIAHLKMLGREAKDFKKLNRGKYFERDVERIYSALLAYWAVEILKRPK